MIRTIVLSLIAHLCFFGLLVALQLVPAWHMPKKKQKFVRIVTLGGGEMGGGGKASTLEQLKSTDKPPEIKYGEPTPAPTPYPTPIGTPIDIAPEKAVVKKTPKPTPAEITPKPEAPKVTPKPEATPIPIKTPKPIAPKKAITPTPEVEITPEPKSEKEVASADPTPKKDKKTKPEVTPPPLDDAPAGEKSSSDKPSITPPPLDDSPRNSEKTGTGGSLYGSQDGIKEGVVGGEGSDKKKAVSFAAPGGGGNGPGMGGGPGSGVAGLPGYYGPLALTIIRQNFVAMGYQRQSKTCDVLFTLQHDGTITDIEVYHTTGVESLDQLAVNALQRTKKLPPLPSAVQEPFLRLVVTFDFSLQQ